MNKMLNRNIKIDFHIHSNASKHKENSEVVKESTEENLDILFGKLTEQGVNLFSFTDHNVFDKSLFLKAKQLIDSKMYPEILGIIPGIEFDTKLDEDANNYGHMLVLFDYKEESDLDRIVNVMEGNEININDYYEKETFEKILRDIGLSVIIFASQTRDPKNNSSKGDRSFNAQTVDQEMYIKIGYIDGFEFQKGRVQGMIKRYLRGINANEFPLITNSDCHDWKHYPYHDENQTRKTENEEKSFTTIKCLPTFRGLLTAITSPETRIDRNLENDEEVKVIKTISIGRDIVEMSPGINVIIGDNGIGKTAILEILNSNYSKKRKANHYLAFQKENKIDIDFVSGKVVNYLEQSGITSMRNDGTLLENINVNESIDTTPFRNKIEKYRDSLKKYLQTNIEINSKKKKLENIVLQFSDSKNWGNPFFVHVVNDLSTENYNNVDYSHVDELKNVIETLEKHLKTEVWYSAEQLQKIDIAIKNLQQVFDELNDSRAKLDNENFVKNIIVSHITNYESVINTKRTTKDKALSKYEEDKQNMKTEIMSLISKLNMENKICEYPRFEDGYGEIKISEKGFTFIKKAKFSETETKNEFFEMVFNQEFKTKEKILQINSIETLSKSVKGSTSDIMNDIFNKFDNNVKKFIEEMCNVTDDIFEATTNSKIGNTPGQLAYTYLKFNFLENKDWNLLILDQPEENLSSQKISNELITYLNKIRDNKQIIIVTHTPLLVVNLDADNIIFLSKENDRLKAKSGCLEYVDSKIDMLKIIADNIEGGAQSIKRRLKLYETQNWNSKE
jgi:predicted ATPase